MEFTEISQAQSVKDKGNSEKFVSNFPAVTVSTAIRHSPIALWWPRLQSSPIFPLEAVRVRTAAAFPACLLVILIL